MCFLCVQDKKADMVVNTYADDVMRLLVKELNIAVGEYSIKNDPTRQPGADLWLEHFTKKEWTIGQRVVNATRKRLTESDLRPTIKKPRRSKEPAVKQEQVDADGANVSTGGDDEVIMVFGFVCLPGSF